MPEPSFFYLAVSCILLHEMDAVRCREWRIFPGLSLLEENLAFRTFMLAHLPLYFLLFWSLAEPVPAAGVIRGLDLFFIVHLGLHLLYLRHPRNQFKDALSWTFIGGAALGGAVDLCIR